MKHQKSKSGIPTKTGGLAAFYRINRRTVLRWRSAEPPAPFHDPERLREWAAWNLRVIPEDFARRLEELSGGVGESEPDISDQESAELFRWLDAVSFLGRYYGVETVDAAYRIVAALKSASPASEGNPA